MTSLTAPQSYPLSPVDALKKQYIGLDIRDVEGPAAVLDRGIVKRNCDVMLDAAKVLGVGFRAHVKTHKTIELSALQVGEDTAVPANFIVSTVSEAESLAPLAARYISAGRNANILYGIPPSKTSLPRLHRVRDALGPGTVTFMIDHPAQLSHLAELYHQQGEEPAPFFIKIDAGYQRAGITSSSASLRNILLRADELKDKVGLVGFYTHYGTSYSSSSPDEALGYLNAEFEEGLAAVDAAKACGWDAQTQFVISVGATPTTASAQNLLNAGASRTETAAKAKGLLEKVKAQGKLELHAGVYPTLDMQQMATHARGLSVGYADIGIWIIAEVLSVYDERNRAEALVGAGCVALGREVCKSYSGWAVVAPKPWERTSASKRTSFYDPDGSRTGWIVGRVAQEHGILVWEGDETSKADVQVGEKLALWPNHACIASSGYGWYLVVEGDGKIVDVWPRWRGW